MKVLQEKIKNIFLQVFSVTDDEITHRREQKKRNELFCIKTFNGKKEKQNIETVKNKSI